MKAMMKLIIDEKDRNLESRDHFLGVCKLEYWYNDFVKSSTVHNSKLISANVNFYEECKEISPSSFKDVIDNIEKLRAYFVYQNTNEKTFHELI